MIIVNDTIAIDERDVEERFIRSSGPGGQNVNKVATAVQIRFDAAGSGALDEATKARLKRRAGRRMTADGTIVITAQRYRSQDANRRDALARLVALIRAAAEAPKKRRPTRPTLASKQRRLEAKKHRGRIKAGRGAGGAEE